MGANASPARRALGVSLGLGALLVLVALVALSIGPAEKSPLEALRVLAGGPDQGGIMSAVVWRIRLPRVILAGTVGATLALGGLVLQALLRNPLAEPYILGVSGGSAIGAILALLAGWAAFPGTALCAFAGSLAAVGAVLLLSGGGLGLRKDALLLGGVMINAFCSAVIMFLISLGDRSEIHQILFWLMGDLSMARPGDLPLLLVVAPCVAVVFALARPMNLLLMGRESAAAMGVSVKAVSLALLVTTSLMVSVVVSQSGLIGFVGLVVPHVLRLLLGPDHRVLVPGCLLGGGAFLILADLLARVLPATGEMPVGVITAMIGAPVFILLLWRGRR